MNEIVINKVQSIQRCVERAREEYSKNPDGFNTDYTVQDAAVLNILRACDLAIDLANHLIRQNKMGIPTSSAESFDLLERKDIIDGKIADKLKKMVGFRNTVVHEYRKLNIEIVKSVITADLDDLILFTDMVMGYADGNP